MLVTGVLYSEYVTAACHDVCVVRVCDRYAGELLDDADANSVTNDMYLFDLDDRVSD